MHKYATHMELFTEKEMMVGWANQLPRMLRNYYETSYSDSVLRSCEIRKPQMVYDKRLMYTSPGNLANVCSCLISSK